MSNSITQDMNHRQSLMKYAEKYGVKRASRKYNKSRSYIYFWRARWDGTVNSLACQSKRPHGHPRQHTEEELKLIRPNRIKIRFPIFSEKRILILLSADVLRLRAVIQNIHRAHHLVNGRVDLLFAQFLRIDRLIDQRRPARRDQH